MNSRSRRLTTAPSAAVDEWSGDKGVGALYFSQQAVNKLACPPREFRCRKNWVCRSGLRKFKASWPKATRASAKIYETIGVYFGYALAHYADFYNSGIS